MRMRSNAYTLTVRQGPERAKAFAGPKEKGEPLLTLLYLQDTNHVCLFYRPQAC